MVQCHRRDRSHTLVQQAGNPLLWIKIISDNGKNTDNSNAQNIDFLPIVCYTFNYEVFIGCRSSKEMEYI